MVLSLNFLLYYFVQLPNRVQRFRLLVGVALSKVRFFHESPSLRVAHWQSLLLLVIGKGQTTAIRKVFSLSPHALVAFLSLVLLSVRLGVVNELAASAPLMGFV